ncbi:MAG TPA: hypothetical protein VF143_04315, partial [Candidatus Nanopelagicales bacterium]
QERELAAKEQAAAAAVREAEAQRARNEADRLEREARERASQADRARAEAQSHLQQAARLDPDGVQDEAARGAEPERARAGDNGGPRTPRPTSS